MYQSFHSLQCNLLKGDKDICDSINLGISDGITILRLVTFTRHVLFGWHGASPKLFYLAFLKKEWFYWIYDLWEASGNISMNLPFRSSQSLNNVNWQSILIKVKISDVWFCILRWRIQRILGPCSGLVSSWRIATKECRLNMITCRELMVYMFGWHIQVYSGFIGGPRECSSVISYERWCSVEGLCSTALVLYTWLALCAV